MTYRDVPRPAVCHPTITAAMPCAACARPMCESCLQFEGASARCGPCTARARRRRTLERVGWLSAALLAAAASGAAGLVPAPPMRFELGANPSPGLRFTAQQLAERPCDPQEAAYLAERLVDEGETRLALDFSDRFMARCPRLHARAVLPSRYCAHRRRREFSQALDDVTAALDDSPHDDFLRFWHIAALEEAGRPDEAADELAALARDTSARGPADRLTDRHLPALPSLPPGSTGFEHLPLRIARFFDDYGRVCHGAAALRGYAHWFPSRSDEASALYSHLGTECPPWVHVADPAF